MSAVLLSIITITKNDPEGCRRTLESAATFRAVSVTEHIVIDGSAVHHGFASSVGCRWYHQLSHGIGGAFNEGLAKARGEWVWFLNGGDLVDGTLSPDFLVALLTASHADAIIGGLVYDGAIRPQPHYFLSQQWPSFVPWIPHPSTIVRKSLFDRVGLYDERYSIAMDYEWWLRAFSDDVQIDILSVRFARFAPGGLSQRAESRLTLVSERDDAIRRHQKRLWKTFLSRGCQLTKAWLTAQLAKPMAAGARKGEL